MPLIRRPHPSALCAMAAIGLLLTGGAACLDASEAIGEPACVLGWPGVGESFVLFSDGSVRGGTQVPRTLGPIELDRAPKPGGTGAAAPTLAWIAPGVRIVQSTQEFDGVNVVSLTAADMYGRPVPSLWLFRTVTLTNLEPEAQSCRMRVRVTCDRADGDLALRRDSVLTQGGGILLVTSRKADGLQVSEDSGEAMLLLDIDLAPKATAELLLAAPSASTIYDDADAPDMSRLDASDLTKRITSRWRQAVVPDVFAVGRDLVNQAFHAAVSSLLLFPPGEEARNTEAAAWLSALARAHHGAAAGDLVQSLVEEQRSGRGPAMAANLVSRADLTTALADYARHADDPERMGRILFAALSAATDGLVARTPEAADPHARSRMSLALREAANVADLIGKHAESASWRQQAADVLPESSVGSPIVDIADPFGSRVGAAPIAGQPTPALPSAGGPGLSIRECFGRAHLAVLAGTPADRLLAWQAVEDRLRAQPLPGVFMEEAREDTLAAAQLVTLICDSVCQAEGGELHLFPALPIGWLHDGRLVELAQFPSGLGPLDLRASSGKARATLDPLAPPKGISALKVSPPLAVETVGLGVNGRRLGHEAFADGPPWAIDPKAQEIVMRFARPPKNAPR
jgi:hypothetical protein